MKLKYFFLMLCCAAFCSSCFKEDTAIVLPPPGNANVMTIPMGETYDHQVYFDLQTADTSGSNYFDWDLAFQSNANDFHIYINGGSQALVANMGAVSFTSVTDTAGCLWSVDPASWNSDSTAIGNWCDALPAAASHNEIFILDRGGRYADSERFYKIIFQSVSSTQYVFKYQTLFGLAGEHTATMVKDSSRNFNYFTFNNGGTTIEPEPDKAQWDLQFTHYRYIYYQFTPPFPYAVSGVLINPTDTWVAKDSVTSFEKIDYAKALTYTYSNARDIIGFSWKAYSFTTQSYSCKPYIIYIIKDQHGFYWKLHFIDFYNNAGIKGYPKFEWQRL